MASAKEIPPGGEGKIDVTFKTGTGHSGPKEKTITVTTNDPAQQAITLRVSTVIQVPLAIDPARINFGQVKKGLEHVQYAALSGDDKDKTKITGIECPNPDIKIEFKQEGVDGTKEHQIKITLPATMKTGRFFDRATVRTDHKDVKDLQLYINGEVAGDIVVVPNQLHFGIFKKGNPIPERVLNVRALGDTTFKILDVKSTIPEVSTIIETVQPGREYRIKASLRQGFEGKSLNGKLIITTDHKETNQLEVSIAGRLLTATAGDEAPAVAPIFMPDSLSEPAVKQRPNPAVPPQR